MIGSIQGNMPAINPQEMFKKMDKNGDGGIDESEFAEMAKGKGRDPSKIMARLDTNKDGKVDLSEMEAGKPNRTEKSPDPSQIPKPPADFLEFLRQNIQFQNSQSGSQTLNSLAGLLDLKA